MITINPKEVSVSELHAYLLGVIAPRPIAFASTINLQGQVNLSPFSYFNVFGSNPPILVFSPSRRVRDQTVKHTLENILEHPEVVINIVNYAMVEQMSLASTEYEKGINEFVKAGFTEEKSVMVRPPRVGEAPASFECKVKQTIETGQGGGAGHLIICEVVLAHIREDILNEEGKVDPHRLDAVARMGGEWYCRAQGEALFTLPKPSRPLGIGFDQLPESIRHSQVLTGNELARLASVPAIPDSHTLQQYEQETPILQTKQQYGKEPVNLLEAMHKVARQYLNEGCVEKAWAALLAVNNPKMSNHT